MMAAETGNVQHTIQNSNTQNPDEYFFSCLKYEHCIYILAIIGAVSQLVAIVVIIVHLSIGLDSFVGTDLKEKSIVYSAICIKVLTVTACTELYLMRAIKTRFLRYIQWWVVSTMIIYIFTLLVTVIAAFTLYNKALWITLSFLYLVIRLPFQVHFVDKFTHVEILHKEPHSQDLYKAVHYNRFV